MIALIIDNVDKTRTIKVSETTHINGKSYVDFDDLFEFGKSAFDHDFVYITDESNRYYLPTSSIKYLVSKDDPSIRALQPKVIY